MKVKITQSQISARLELYKRISTGQINFKKNTNTDVKKKSNTVHKILLDTFNRLLYTIIVFC